MLLLMCRQAGKSTLAGALALRTALLEPGSLVLLLAPTERQSGELFKDKVLRLYNALGRPIQALQETALTLTLANGSRVVSLPGKEGTIRGYSRVRLLVIDEASRVADELYRGALRPMLAVSQGQLIAMSTPWGKRGWFYEEWIGQTRWERVRISADRCPRISKEFLEEERASLGERYFRQEYECSFEDVVGALFNEEDIQSLLVDAPPPLFGS
jgi:hypothetical protein